AATVAASLAEYRADPRVQSVDRDRTRDAEATPNDPSYPDQWALPQIGWDQAYGSTTISGISTIAVLDTGVQSSDVPSGPGWSAFGNDPNTDPNGHGTWIASIAGATTDHGQGIAGVGFDATDQTDSLWSGSNSSAAVFLTAPGVGIKADDTIAPTVSVTGTSASAAIVAGSAAQLMAVDPSASPGVIVGRLARNADP